MKSYSLALLISVLSASASYAQAVANPTDPMPLGRSGGMFDMSNAVPSTPAPAPAIIHPAGTIDMTTAVPLPLSTTGAKLKDGTMQAPDPKPADWKQPDLTFGHAVMQLLCNDRPNGDDAHEAGMAKITRCNLGVKIQDEQAYKPTTDDKKLIEDHISLWPALIGREIIKFVAPEDVKN